jgi:hypothetical protein
MKIKNSALIIAQNPTENKHPSASASFQMLGWADSFFGQGIKEFRANLKLPRSLQSAEKEFLVGKTVFAFLAGGEG